MDILTSYYFMCDNMKNRRMGDRFMENKAKKVQEIFKIINEVIKITGNIIVLVGLISAAYKIRKSYFEKSYDNSGTKPNNENFVEAYGERKEDDEII